MIFVALILIVTVSYVIYSNIKDYKEESYYKITNIPYSIVKRDLGKYGEYLTYKYLKSFEEQGAKFLFNIYMPKKDETTEIDVLMISQKGIFVFESKNYSGWIFGDDTRKYWYQTLPTGRGRSQKEKFYNPVFQNNTHVKYLKSLIGDTIPIYSIITFSDRCELMNVQIHNYKVSVINRYQVHKLISSIYNDNPCDVLTESQVEEIYNKLYPYTQVDFTIKQQHIENIHNHLNPKAVDIPQVTNEELNEESEEQDNITSQEDELDNTNVIEESTIDLSEESEQPIEDKKEEEMFCPLCGGKLVLRKAKHGSHVGEEFYGCTNYPRCKYIKK